MKYPVTDMHAVAFLLCRGIRHVAIQPTDKSGQLAFIYDNPAAREAVSDYYCGATVPARTYADCLRAAKSLIYDQKPVYRKSHEEFLAKQDGAR